MEREIIKTLKVLTTGKYCGNHENHIPCPQHVTTKMGTTYHCGAFYSDDGQLYSYLEFDENILGLIRCNKCLEYFNEEEIN